MTSCYEISNYLGPSYFAFIFFFGIVTIKVIIYLEWNTQEYFDAPLETNSYHIDNKYVLIFTLTIFEWEPQEINSCHIHSLNIVILLWSVVLSKKGCIFLIWYRLYYDLNDCSWYNVLDDRVKSFNLTLLSKSSFNYSSLFVTYELHTLEINRPSL